MNKRTIMYAGLAIGLGCLWVFGLRPYFLQPERAVSTSSLTKKDRTDLAMAHELEMTQDPALGVAPRERLLRAYAEAQRRQVSGRGAIPGISWEERGPDNVAGRTRAIWIDRNDPTHETVWAAGVSGGLWKCTQISAPIPHWEPQDDFFDNLAITSIVQDPAQPQVMYFGTGEGWFNIGSVRGLGLWKSTDGGASWFPLPSTRHPDFHYTQKLVIDAAGHLYAATRAQGLLKSTDGGQSWTPSLGAGQPAADVEIAANGDLYASLGIFSSGSLHKSQDGGQTWTALGAGLPASGYERIEIACAPADPDRVYVLLQDAQSRQCQGIYRTDDGGTTWTSLPVPAAFGMNNFARAQAWYNLIAAVDPLDPDRVFIGGIDLHLSTDAGASWTQLTQWVGAGGLPYMHADQHAIVFDPANPAIAYIGNDGGIYRTVNAGANRPTFVSRNTGFNITQFYAGALSPERGRHVLLGGTQDNGTQYFRQSGINSTTEVTGGDGGFCHIDEDEPQIQLSSYIFNNYHITQDGWRTHFSHYYGNMGRFINPTGYDSRANRLYACGEAGEWIRVSQIGRDWPVFEAQALPALGGEKISAVAVSPYLAHQVWLGTGNGRVLRVDSAHLPQPIATVVNAGAGMPQAYISCLAIAPDDPLHLLVTYANYGVASVWETPDGGQTWHNREGNLPDMPVRWAIFHPSAPHQALLATELGVWSTTNLHSPAVEWGPSNSGLAHVRTDMLHLRPTDHTLLAATHGRGFFTSTSLLAPIISFRTDRSSVSEELPPPATGCRAYQDIDIPLQIIMPPQSEAVLRLETQGSARRGVDYDLLTPTVTFPAGDTTDRMVRLRLYDDHTIEPPETIVLSYTLEGATDAVAGRLQQTHTLTLISADGDALGQEATLWEESFSLPSPEWIRQPDPDPTSAPANRWIFAEAGQDCPQMLDDATAIVVHHAQGDLSCGYDGQTPTQTYLYRPVDARPYGRLRVGFDWIGEGEKSGHMAYDYAQLVYSTDHGQHWTATGPVLQGRTTRDQTVIDLPDSLGRRRFHLGWRWTNDHSIAGSPSFGLDNVAVQAILTRQVATEGGTQGSGYLGPWTTVNFLDGDQLIARLENQSDHDFGCTTVTIDRSGHGVQDFWHEQSPPRGLADKTYWIAPSHPAPDAAVSLTLYYTPAEVDGWTRASGKSFFTEAKMVRNGGAIRRVTPAQIYPDGNSVAQAVDTVWSTPVAYAIQARWAGAAGGYGLGDPGLPPVAFPVHFLRFDATVSGPGLVDLYWQVGEEMDLMTYEITRGSGSGALTRIADVAPQGLTAYRYADKGLAPGSYTYRLLARDLDGAESYSPLREVTLTARWQVSPNPFGRDVSLHLPVEAEGRYLDLALFSTEGRLLWQARRKAIGRRLTLDFGSLALAAGTYQLRVLVPGYDYRLFTLQKQ